MSIFTSITNFFLPSALSGVNGNFDTIETELAARVRRDGTLPMLGNLDMNSKRIINLGTPLEGSDLVRLEDIRDIASESALYTLLGTAAGAGAIGTVSGETVEASLAHGGSFTPAGTGALTETTQEALRRFPVSPEQFGAVGDAVYDEDTDTWSGTDDTAAWSAVLAAGKNILARKGAVYYTTASLGAPLAGAVIDGNGSKIVGDWEQATPATDPNAVYEAMIFMTERDNVTIKNLEFEYVGTFDVGTNPALDSYGGLVSCIHANACDNLMIDNCEIHGANRAGILIGALVNQTDDAAIPYSLNPTVVNCDVHHCRVGNVIYGRTENGLVYGNKLRFAGHPLDIGTGYGFAGYSTGIPKNTIVCENHAVDNYRKGIDWHSGINGVVSNNICLRNRCDGIYAMGVSGSWTVNGNVIRDMAWTGEFPAEMCAIRLGELVGQGTNDIPTSFTVEGNSIGNFGITSVAAWAASTAYGTVGQLVLNNGLVYKLITPGTSAASGGPTGTATSGITDGTAVWGYGGTQSCFPIFLGGHGLSYGSFKIVNNTLRLGKVTKIVECQPATATDNPGNYFDVSFDNNDIVCSETVSVPVAIRGTFNRKKSFNNNKLQVTTVGGTTGIYSYDNTSITNNSCIANGNDLTCPSSSWFGTQGNPINARQTANVLMVNNLVNGVPWRDWLGRKFKAQGTGAFPATDYSNWIAGSIWERTDVAAGGSPGAICTTAGIYASAWVASTAYGTVGAVVTNDSGKVYRLLTAGTSAASGGPTGTATSITDGTAVWQYVGLLAVFKALPAIAS